MRFAWHFLKITATATTTTMRNNFDYFSADHGLPVAPCVACVWSHCPKNVQCATTHRCQGVAAYTLLSRRSRQPFLRQIKNDAKPAKRELRRMRTSTGNLAGSGVNDVAMFCVGRKNYALLLRSPFICHMLHTTIIRSTRIDFVLHPSSLSSIWSNITHRKVYGLRMTTADMSFYCILPIFDAHTQHPSDASRKPHIATKQTTKINSEMEFIPVHTERHGAPCMRHAIYNVPYQLIWTAY